MVAVPDALAGLFLGSFLLGLLFILLSALMGLTHSITHLPGFHDGVHVGGLDGHAGHLGGETGHGGGAGRVGDGATGHPEGHAEALGHGAGRGVPGSNDGGERPTSGVTASPLNLTTVMAFLTWFGGAGYILHAIYRVFLPISLAGAAIAGLLAGWLVFLLLVKVFLPGTVTPEYHVVGSLASVTIAIPAGGSGEVVYHMGGARHSDGARSVDGRAIPRGTEVVILRYAKGIAYVEPWRRLVDTGGASES